MPLRRKSCVRTEPEGGPPAIRKDLKRTSYDCQAFRTSPRGVRISEGVQDWLHRFVWQNDRATEAPSHFAFPFRRGALASEATFLTPAHQPKTEKNRERKRQRANRAGVGEKSQRRVADYPLHRLSNQPVFQTEIPPTGYELTSSKLITAVYKVNRQDKTRQASGVEDATRRFIKCHLND